MGVKSLGVFLVMVGVAISEMSGGPPETGINQPAPAATNNVRIVGGKEAKPGEFPHQLFMEFRNETTDTWDFICGAFILNSRWALTAAHCVYGFERKPELFTLHAGHLSRSKNTTGSEQEYKVMRIAVHAEYNNKTHPNDIALMRINGSFDFSKPIVQPAKILMKPEVLNGKTGVVSGWGMVHSSGAWNASVPDSDILRRAQLVILHSEECQFYHGFNKVMHTCAKGCGRGACKGDSGGPLEVKGKVVGITSFGYKLGCSLAPEVYTRVSTYSDWIQEVTSFA